MLATLDISGIGFLHLKIAEGHNLVRQKLKHEKAN
jgi:hypothetical protein